MDWINFREPVSAWTHFLWMLLALPGTWVLFRLSRGDRLKQFAMLAFGLGLVSCYGGSWLYHAVRLPPAGIHRYNTLDHIGIYCLIAGSATPIALVILRGWWRRGLLGTIWLMALAGIALCLTADLPLGLRTAFYLVMGWVGCLTYFELARHLSHAKLRPIWLGGLAYSVGAVINLVGWPVLAPGVFGAHELFHLFVMAGSLFHYYFMLAVVVPFERVVDTPAEAEPALPPFPATLAQQPAEG